MKTLIVGCGEIGKALHSVLNEVYEVDCVDINTIPCEGSHDIMHICFPFSETFVREVKKYQALYAPRYTVIHATVPPGTSRECGALSSPTIGLHPFLAKSLTTFTKFIGGENASEVADYFRRAGMKVYLVKKQETLELMKILDTNFYKKCIEYTQEVYRYCDKYHVPFEAWTLWTNNYNQGYQSLGFPEYTRPNLVPIMKEIGGHCLVPNSTLLPPL